MATYAQYSNDGSTGLFPMVKRRNVQQMPSKAERRAELAAREGKTVEQWMKDGGRLPEEIPAPEKKVSAQTREDLRRQELQAARERAAGLPAGVQAERGPDTADGLQRLEGAEETVPDGMPDPSAMADRPTYPNGRPADKENKPKPFPPPAKDHERRFIGRDIKAGAQDPGFKASGRAPVNLPQPVPKKKSRGRPKKAATAA